ncbi:MAG: glycoside-pentoside-hexuronide (GPH):cation symporter [Lachnospiraceae bacterium]|nr:glycoside-pentoside-hexuronide (GPH):cation symporter [Lachnospiraceae bacterium]
MNNERLPLWRKIGYGMGDAGANFCWTFIAAFIMIYCTNTLGVSAAVIGSLMMFSKILDGVSDVVMGRIIDRTHSKLGKARFWYLVSILPLAIFTFLIFNVPTSLSDNGKCWYVFIMYTVVGAVFYTANNVAYSSMTALCTKDPEDRVQMGSYRFVCAIAAVLIISSFTTGLVEKFGGGQQGWTAVSLIYAIVTAVCLLIPFFSVKELPQDDTAEETKKQEKGEIFKDLACLVKNKYFILILIMYICMYIMSGVMSGMGVYFATYQLKDASLLGVLNMANRFPFIVALPLVPYITAKFGMRKSIILGDAFGIIGSVLIIAGGLTANFPMILVGFVIRTVGTSPQTGALNALIAETDEYSFLKFGRRMTGTIYSCSSMGIKIGTGIGVALCGFLLDFSGFDGMATEQAASAITAINWSYLLGVALLPVISIIIFSLLNVEKANEKLRNEMNA